MSQTIYILDDEQDMIKVASGLLKDEGYLVRFQSDPTLALKEIQQTLPDLLLLDVRMPKMDGLQVCREIKNNPKTHALPIIMVSVKSQESDVITGLELGAEDYIRKPYHQGELLARIRTALRRTKPAEVPKKLTVGPLSIDYNRYEAKINDRKIDLRPKEFELLGFLLQREGQVLTRATISQKVWKIEHLPTSRTIDFHVDQLRKKLGTYGPWIKSLKGVGYRFEVEE